MAAKAPLIAITGGTGFVGARVIHYALDAGYRVRALIRNTNKKLDIEHANLSWHKGSLGSDDAAFVEGVDTVIHIAGLIKAQKRQDYYEINAHAAGALAKHANQHRVKRFVHLSSMAAQVPELSDYAGSKRAGEDAVKAEFDGPLVIIRAPAVFGPGDEATAPFFTAIKRGILPVPGGHGWRKRKLSMAYVDDLARDIIQSAVAGDYDGQTVSPATLPSLTWPEFAELCSQSMGLKVRAVPLPLSILYPVAGITSATSRLFGRGHLTLGKLGEFLYGDWSSDDLIKNATAPKDALEATMRYYEKDSL